MAYNTLTEADMAPWKVTASQVPWFGKLYAATNLEAGQHLYEEAVREYRKNFPHCTAAVVFHESLPDSLPLELGDVTPPPLTDAQTKAAKERWDMQSSSSP